MNSPAFQNSNPIEALEKVLLSELEMYEQFAAYVRNDTELMSKLQIDQLEQSNKAKNTLLLKIQTLDQARQNLVRQIATQLQIPEDKVRIAEICKVVGGHSSKRLSQIRERLHSTIENLKEVQGQTSLLANASLGWINGSLTALKGLLTPVGTYNFQGKVEANGMFSGRTVERQV
jgi:flagellar biosynthesis/type III secretory pathway chaperone